MKYFRIRPEFLTLWGEETTADTVVTMNDIEELAADWEKPVEDLMQQVEEVCLLVNGGRYERQNVVINSKLYAIVSFVEKDANGTKHYSFYIEPASLDYPMEYMFSVPIEQQEWKEAFEMAECEARANIDIYSRSWI